jgi:phosphoglycolate phosphatase
MTRTVLLDLDGTLIDPKVGVTRCIAHALTTLHHESPHADALEWCIGPPLANSFATLLDTKDAALIARALTLYRERFSAMGLFENTLFPGITRMLGALNTAGLHAHVATSKPHVFATRIVAHFSLLQYLGTVYGAELDGQRAEKTELIGHVLRARELDARQTVMVGDRKHDVLGAKACGVAAIGVTYGYGTAEELRTAGADRIVDAPDQILEAVTDLLGKS